MSKLLAHPGALCNMVRRIAVVAGNRTLDYFDDSGVYPGYKDDGSPVTEADHASEALIIDGLRDILPDIPIIAEESFAAGHAPDIANADYFWLVDPLDGTRGFITGSGDYTVNIALIRNGQPLLGVVYAPVPGELYAGHGPGTAIRWLEDVGQDREIRTRQPKAKGLTVVASRHYDDPAALDRYLEGHKVARLIRRSSSLKICVVASGKADLYPRLGPTCEWDTAAGDAVLRSAGGMIADMDGHPFTYGHTSRKFVNPPFQAAAMSWFDPVDQGA